MTFTCYEPNNAASVMGIDLTTGVVTNFSKAPGTYNEVEGIFPDGQYTCVEGDRQVETLGGRHGANNIDIWKLKLDGTGKDFVRLTHFNDYDAGKASNPVVSTDGRFMAFQAAKTTDPAGVGYGIVVLWFRKDAGPMTIGPTSASWISVLVTGAIAPRVEHERPHADCRSDGREREEEHIVHDARSFLVGPPDVGHRDRGK